jgi:sulfur carrier protein
MSLPLALFFDRMLRPYRAFDSLDVHRLKLIFCSAMSNPSNPDSVSLQVNGEPKTCAPHTPLPQLLEQLKMNPRLVAVEYNGEILHRQFWQETEIQEGDRLEIVTIVGGG